MKILMTMKNLTMIIPFQKNKTIYKDLIKEEIKWKS